MTRPLDDGLQVIDFTGLQQGNADIADSCVWSPPQGEPERPGLPVYPTPADLWVDLS